VLVQHRVDQGDCTPKKCGGNGSDQKIDRRTIGFCHWQATPTMIIQCQAELLRKIAEAVNVRLASESESYGAGHI
jgi:hypothetical protein